MPYQSYPQQPLELKECSGEGSSAGNFLPAFLFFPMRAASPVYLLDLTVLAQGSGTRLCLKALSYQTSGGPHQRPSVPTPALRGGRVLDSRGVSGDLCSPPPPQLGFALFATPSGVLSASGPESSLLTLANQQNTLRVLLSSS